MSPSLTILVVAADAVGHVNACAGALSELIYRGHRVNFVLESAWKGKLSKKGFEEFIYSNQNETASITNQKNQTNPGEEMAAHMLANKIIGPFEPTEKMQNMIKYFESKEIRKSFARFDRAVKEALDLYKPDLVYVDGPLMPSIYESKRPWIWQISANPIYFVFDEDVPPGGFGLPTKGDRSTWPECNRLRRELLYCKDFNDMLQEMGYPRYPEDHVIPYESASMVVYAYPDELNYPQVKSRDWFNLELFHKKSIFERVEKVRLTQLVPEEFMYYDMNDKWSRKWIYVSMGSMGSVDLVLMKRLVEILGKTNHKYIVSKGPRHSEYNLARNMYGDRYLPQTAIIPHVDLVITHGGNNTVTEVFAEGKPMIVMPLFSDQFDNAQRLQETGYGVRLDPYNFQNDDLINSIEIILYDRNLPAKLEAASKRIQAQNRHEQLAMKIEQLINRN